MQVKTLIKELQKMRPEQRVFIKQNYDDKYWALKSVSEDELIDEDVITQVGESKIIARHAVILDV